MKNNAIAVFMMLGLAAMATLSAYGEVLDRPTGIKIGQRMTLRPYVSAAVTYDSNVDAYGSGTRDEEGDILWTVSPGLGLTYNAETWSLDMSGYYSYRSYTKSEFDNYNEHNYGEDVRWNWSNASGADKGWSLLLSESFRQITMAEDMMVGSGQNYSGDQRQLQLSGALQRRFNERWHADLNGSYYWLDYMNDKRAEYTYYGWDRWTVGAEAGFAPSPWTDFLVSGAYMGYTQDNLEGSEYDDSSVGWQLQAGIGSYMTERISYRLLVGWSRFEYADNASSDDGFVYTATGNWKIGETWNTMLMASSYYQPSERQYASKSRVDALSWGLAKSMIRGKLRATLDLLYRHETNEQITDAGNDYTLDIVTGRVGLNYVLNRFFTFFAYAEYQSSWNDEASSHYDAYDYDRWRVTGGIRLTY